MGPRDHPNADQPRGYLVEIRDLTDQRHANEPALVFRGQALGASRDFGLKRPAANRFAVDGPLYQRARHKFHHDLVRIPRSRRLCGYFRRRFNFLLLWFPLLPLVFGPSATTPQGVSRRDSPSPHIYIVSEWHQPSPAELARSH